jgi:predicted AlkP superfamily pyrophosphatase or phosphodiesterase
VSERVIVVGWDGLRPDLVSPDVTPNLHRLIASGARFAASSAVFPSETRPNNASIGTGCYPGRHGITANPLVADLGGGPRAVDTGRPDDLDEVRLRRGRLLDCATLGEALASAGTRLAVVGSGSPGQTVLQNAHDAGWTINRAVRRPDDLTARVAAARGPWPDPSLGTAAVDEYMHGVALDYVLRVRFVPSKLGAVSARREG